MAFSLDHVVINTLFDMNDAETLMLRLGFTVTPRGHHSLGSINHLMVFDGNFLELIGLPVGAQHLREDVLRSPLGLSGLVFQAGDIGACVRLLRDDGLALLEPQSFSRPVTIEGHEQLARFRTVRTAPELFEAGRVYYCQHHTPNLVWRREWLSHPNRVVGMSELVVVSTTMASDLRHFAKAAQAPAVDRGNEVWAIDLNRFRLTLMSPLRYLERFGTLCVDARGRNSFFGAVVLETDDLSAIRDRAAVIPSVDVSGSAHSVAVRASFLNTLLEFRDDR